MIERLWRAVKYEEVYLKSYGDMVEAPRELGRNLDWYNMERESIHLLETGLPMPYTQAGKPETMKLPESNENRPTSCLQKWGHFSLAEIWSV